MGNSTARAARFALATGTALTALVVVNAPARHRDIDKSAQLVASQVAGRTFHVSGGGVQFNSTLPASSVATYMWTPGASSVNEWLTSTSGTILDQRLTPQPPVPVSSTSPAGSAHLGVDTGRTFQTMTGFGGAMTDSAATLINTSPSRDAIMSSLFGASGARLNFVRVPVGASDLVATPYQSYDDSPLPDMSLSKFSIAHDQTNILPLLRTARQLSPGTTVLASPWSAPAWMKVGDSFYGSCGGLGNTLVTSDYQVYAQYLARFITAYQAAGVPVDLLSLQNEPQHCAPDYPTMNLTADQEASLARYVSAAVGGGTRLLAWDHNWYDEGAAPGAAPTTFPQQVIAGSGGAISAVGYHCYNRDGNPTAYSTQMTGISVYMTECSGFVNSNNAAVNLVNEVRYDLLGPIRYGAKGSLYWSLAQGTDGQPHVGGCATCRGMIGIDRATGAWAPSEDYYYWSQFSRFVAKDAVRIDSTDLGVGSLQTVAFRNTDGTIVLVVLNSANSTDYRGHIVQWDGDTSSPKTSWLVGPDGHRRWIHDTATFNCLRAQGAPTPNVLPSETLDTMPDLTGVWAVCGADRIGANSMLQTNFYLRSGNGQYTLRLTGANLTLTTSSGAARWSTGRGGEDLILQDDGNLVEYAGGPPVWASGTAGSGAQWLVLTNAGKLALYDSSGHYVWTSEGTPGNYVDHIVQWDGDPNTQKTSWLVGPDGHRRWIHDMATYNCIKASGGKGPDVLTSWELDQMPDLTNVWAVCGTDRIGVNSMLQTGLYARSPGGTTLKLAGSNLTLTNHTGQTLWSTGHGGDDLVLQTDGNVVEYSGGSSVWASDTVGSGGVWLVVGDDGKLALYDSAGNYVWTSEGPPSRYVGHIVQWEGDTSTQKTAWLVTSDGHRNWTPSSAVYNCLKSHGATGPDVLTAWELNQLPDDNGVWATCV
ncbi:glycoside hydrolase family 30 beta sandwich domain-containing protein [uncultured Jatrophihabitans sp.]|uniref:glycoside hydrolase family 30 beta sandwich domain-containing protein n=1 Tax=uncultured Jatrophihabitans sp. TaxID=1610747 RepID=UPI0035CA74A1